MLNIWLANKSGDKNETMLKWHQCYMKMRKIVLFNEFSCRCLLAWISAAKNEQQQDPVSKVSKTKIVSFSLLQSLYSWETNLQSIIIFRFPRWYWHMLLVIFILFYTCFQNRKTHIFPWREINMLTQNRKKT